MRLALAADHVDDDSRMNEYFRQRCAELADLITGALRSGQASDQIRPDVDVDTEAHMLLAMMDGAVVQHHLTSGRVSMADIVSRYLDQLLARVSVTPSAG